MPDYIKKITGGKCPLIGRPAKQHFLKNLGKKIWPQTTVFWGKNYEAKMIHECKPDETLPVRK